MKQPTGAIVGVRRPNQVDGIVGAIRTLEAGMQKEIFGKIHRTATKIVESAGAVVKDKIYQHVTPEFTFDESSMKLA